MENWSRRPFDLAGLGIEVVVEHPVQRAVVLEYAGALAAHRGPASIHVGWRTAPLDLREAELVGSDGHRRAGVHPRGLAVSRGALSAIALVDAIEIGGVDEDVERCRDDFRKVFGRALTHVLSLREHYPVHAAAISRDGDALLLLGISGVGKSTAAWGAHRAGFDLLADETVFIRPGPSGYEVQGMRTRVSLPSEILDAIPQDAVQHPIRGGGPRDRWLLPPNMLKTGWHRLIGVVTPIHGKARAGALTKRDGRAVLSAAIGAYYGSDQQAQLRSWFPHAARLSRLPAWDLHHSPDPSRRLDAAARWLERAFELASSAAPR